MKRCSISIVIRKISIKTIKRYNFTLTTVQNLRILTIPNSGENVKPWKWFSKHFRCECSLQLPLENKMSSLSCKVERGYSLNFCNSTPSYITQKIIAYVHNEVCSRTIRAVLCIIEKENLKNKLQNIFAGEWINMFEIFTQYNIMQQRKLMN